MPSICFYLMVTCVFISWLLRGKPCEILEESANLENHCLHRSMPNVLCKQVSINVVHFFEHSVYTGNQWAETLPECGDDRQP